MLLVLQSRLATQNTDAVRNTVNIFTQFSLGILQCQKIQKMVHN